MSLELNSKERELLVLIRENERARDLFFSKVESPKFFYPLLTDGHFEPSTIPEPILADDGSGGYHLPFWSPLNFLRRLSIGFRNGETSALISDILEIILKISQAVATGATKNTRIFYSFVEIINTIPSDKISVEFVEEFISIWTDESFLHSTTPEISQNLVPKFLGKDDKPDSAKAEIILKALFRSESYLPKAKSSLHKGYSSDLYWLEHVILRDSWYDAISRHLPDSFLYYLADQLKSIIRHETLQEKYEFIQNGIPGVFRMSVVGENLMVAIDSQPRVTVTIAHFEELDTNTLGTKIINEAAGYGFQSPSDEFRDVLSSAVEKGLFGDYSGYVLKSFFDHDDAIGYDLEETVSKCLLGIANRTCDLREKEGEKLITSFLSNRYRQVTFARMALYLIANHWNEYRELFWRKVDSAYKELFFHSFGLTQEIFQLLRHNVNNYTKDDYERIKRVLQEGLLREDEYWLFRMIVALKDDPEFGKSYLEMSARLNLDGESFENAGKIQIRLGDESPLSKEQILKVDLDNLLKELLEFRSDGFLGATERGFSIALEQAIAVEPDRYIRSISKFKGVAYIYQYGLIRGLETAWKSRLSFDWALLLSYMVDLIGSDDFKSGKLALSSDQLTYGRDSVESAIADLIGSGVRSDEWSFDLALMPQAEEILTRIILESERKNHEFLDNKDVDYPTFSINTLHGRAYRALLDCALRNKRNGRTDPWEQYECKVFQYGIDLKFLELAVLVGWHIRQFYYLDERWLRSVVNDFTIEREGFWKAFIGGYLFDGPTNSVDLFSLMKGHYELAIENLLNFNEEGGGKSAVKGLARHVICYYFWSLDAEGQLIRSFLRHSNQNGMSETVHYLRTQREHITKLSNLEKQQFRSKVIFIWRMISNLLSLKDKPGSAAMADAGDLIIFFDDLSDEILRLLFPSIKQMALSHRGYFLLNHCVNVLKENNTEQNVVSVGRIIIEFLSFRAIDNVAANIRFIVETIYGYPGAKQLADKICDIFLERHRDESLRDIYRKYNP